MDKSEKIKAILDRIEQDRNPTETDLENMRQLLTDSSSEHLIQLGKNIVGKIDGREIHIGDRIYGIEANEILDLFQKLHASTQNPLKDPHSVDELQLSQSTLDNSSYNIQKWRVLGAIPIVLLVIGIPVLTLLWKPTPLPINNASPTPDIATPEPPTNPPITPTPESSSNIDYTELEELLQLGQWKDAYNETVNLMKKVGGIPLDRYFYKDGQKSSEEIKNFPCQALNKIDELWVSYSDGNFGFSVQKQIYLNLVDTNKSNDEVWNDFEQEVGWKKETWLSAENLVYKSSAPKGHLPRVQLLDSSGRYDFFRKKLEECNL